MRGFYIRFFDIRYALSLLLLLYISPSPRGTAYDDDDDESICCYYYYYITMLFDVIGVISIFDEQYRVYGGAPLHLHPLAIYTIHSWIFHMGCPAQVLDMIACYLDDEYYDDPSVYFIVTCISQVLANTELRGYRLVTAATALRRSRTAAAA